MLPYIEQPELHIGPLALHAFGALVVCAVWVGTWVARRRTVRLGLSPTHLEGMLTWVLVLGFVCGHVLDALLYEPSATLAHPLSLLWLWESQGSFGGFVGAVAGGAIYAHRHALRMATWRYLDVIAYAFPFGWIFGRLGCTVAYDHPGKPTSFFLGERYSDGFVRHNLGLEEAIVTVGIAALFFALGRKPRPIGFFVATLAIVYAPVRFLLDTLRIDDARYGGWTPAQWGSIGLLVLGVVLLRLVPWLARRGDPASGGEGGNPA